MTTTDEVRKIALALPGVKEGVSYGTASFKVGGKFLGRILEDGVSMSVYIDIDERRAWCKSAPATFTVPDHFKNYKYMVVHLKTASKGDVQALLKNAWKQRAPKGLVQDFASA